MIGLIGKGVVGTALYESLIKRGNDVKVYDKYKNIGSIEFIINVDIIFLCLSSPYNNKINKYDLLPIEETCNYLNQHNYNGLIAIKSTIEPETCENLSNQYNLNICHNPEFLREKHALEDFDNQEHIVIGKTEKCDEKLVEKLVEFYKKNYENADISVCTSTESELMKISINNFYAVKVQFFNEIYLLAEKLDNCNYDNVKDMMIKNNQIHPSFTQVPGHDGKLSYGGMCFPKDIRVLLQYLKSKETYCGIIEATVNERGLLRAD